MKNFFSKLGRKTRKGIDGLVVAIAILLIAVILIGLFKSVVQPRIQTNIENAATQLDELNN